MNGVALKMLLGDRVKLLGLVFGVAFATLLVSQQTAVFAGLLSRAGAQVRDVAEATIWVMDASVQTIDDSRPIRDTLLARVRGAPGVGWAAPLYKGGAALRTSDGRRLSAQILGVDDVTLVGAPLRMRLGDRNALRRADAVILDEDGFSRLFPGQDLRLGDELELNDRRAVVVGIAETNPTFNGAPLVVARYSQALAYTNNGRTALSFILARPSPGVADAAAAEAIAAATGLKAVTRQTFEAQSRDYIINSTGIPISVGTTVLLGAIVGVAIVGLTFSIFIAENARQFGALKAMGVSNGRLIGMVGVQAVLVGVLGYAIGLGAAGAFFLSAAANVPAFKGFFLPWEVAAFVAAMVTFIMIATGALSLRRVLTIDPAMVFRA